MTPSIVMQTRVILETSYPVQIVHPSLHHTPDIQQSSNISELATSEHDDSQLEDTVPTGHTEIGPEEDEVAQVGLRRTHSEPSDGETVEDVHHEDDQDISQSLD